ncbi:MAG: dicarboxylate/amino acid:cation symporter [Nanobdellota archaeon]
MKSVRERITGDKNHRRVLKSLSDHVLHLLQKKLWLKVLIALALGSVVGVLFGPDMNLISSSLAKTITDWLALPGHLFLALIKMVILPLIVSSIIVGIVSSGDKSFLKKIGPRIALYFVMTTTVAVIIGFTVSNIIAPGTFIDTNNFDLENSDSLDPTGSNQLTSQSIPEQIVNLIPSNPIKTMVQGDLLGIVILSIITALAMFNISKKHFKTTISLLESIQEITMRIIKWVMHIVPLAVFGLIAQAISGIGLDALTGLGIYMLTVVTGLIILLLFYVLIVRIFSRRNPRKFLRAIRAPQLLAFSTSSSAAVMPLSIKTAEEDLKVRKSITEFLVPVGATVNMDGTALYQVTATIFLAQAFGIALPIGTLITIIAITVGASIGTPSVPGVGIVVLATILQSAGIPAVGIALILGVDRILDMCRTTLNVTGDLTACTFFDKHISLPTKGRKQ